MSRPLRLEYPHAFYHIISRGHRQENIFNCDKDKVKFIEKLKETIFKYSIKLHVYVLMDNHYHLLIETPLGNLSQFMHNLNTSYSNWFKTKYQIIGSIFQGRYKSILIDKDAYLLTLSYYIHLNPVRARLVQKPEDYRYSSYKGYVTGKFDKELITVKTILGYFSNKPSLYKSNLDEWNNSNQIIKKEELYGKHGILGDDKFLEKVYKEELKKDKKRDKREIPELNQLEFEIYSLNKEDIKTIILDLFEINEEWLYEKKKNNTARKIYMYALKNFTNLPLKEIGDIFGLDYSTISANVSRLLNSKNKEITKYISQINNRINQIANAKT